MAQTKLFSPEGFHFMVSKTKGFYLMKDPVSGYVKHKLKNGDISSKFVMIDYPPTHNNVQDSFHYISLSKTKSYKPKPEKSNKLIVRSKPTPPTKEVLVRSRGSQTSGGSSGSSGGGGY